MNKNSKMIKLIALIILFIASLVAYFIVQKVNENKEKSEQESEESSSITVGSIETDKVSAFSYSYNGVEYSFQKENDTWICDNDASIELDQDLVNDLAGNFNEVKANRIVEESPSDLSQYGLDQPINKIKVSDTDGNMITYQIGNENQTVSGYYMKTDASDTVYLIDSFPDQFNKTLEDLKKTEDETETDSSSEVDSSAEADNSTITDSSTTTDDSTSDTQETDNSVEE